MKPVSYHHSGPYNFEVDPRFLESVYYCPLKSSSMIVTCVLMIALNTTHHIPQINDRNHEVQYPMPAAHRLTMCNITVLCDNQLSISQGGPTGTNSFIIFLLQQKISIVSVHYLKWTMCYSVLTSSNAPRSTFQLQSVPKRCTHFVQNIKPINLHE
jgi:hypothetical protein